MPIAGVVAGAAAVIDFLGGGPSDLDKARNARSDQLYNAALNGDKLAEAGLRCRAGTTDPAWIALAAKSSEGLDSSGGCANEAGSEAARIYAQELVAKLETARGVAGVAGKLGTGLLGLANNAVPGAGTRAVLQEVPSWVWWAGAATLGVLVFLALRHRRG